MAKGDGEWDFVSSSLIVNRKKRMTKTMRPIFCRLCCGVVGCGGGVHMPFCAQHVVILDVKSMGEGAGVIHLKPASRLDSLFAIRLGTTRHSQLYRNLHRVPK